MHLWLDHFGTSAAGGGSEKGCDEESGARQHLWHANLRELRAEEARTTGVQSAQPQYPLSPLLIPHSISLFPPYPAWLTNYTGKESFTKRQSEYQIYFIMKNCSKFHLHTVGRNNLTVNKKDCRKIKSKRTQFLIKVTCFDSACIKINEKCGFSQIVLQCN